MCNFVFKFYLFLEIYVVLLYFQYSIYFPTFHFFVYFNFSIFSVQRLKDRIIEFVSISNLKNESFGFSVWLIASVGQGKETCARAVASALNRKFVSISMKDLIGDSLKGSQKHGAGEIVRSLIASKCMNPVIYLKEFNELKHDDGTVSGRQSLIEIRKLLSSAQSCEIVYPSVSLKSQEIDKKTKII